MYVGKIYGNIGHTALWSTCKYRLIHQAVPVNITVLYVVTKDIVFKYRLIHQAVPVNITVLYVVTKDIVFKGFCKLCLKKGDILEIKRFYLQKTN